MFKVGDIVKSTLRSNEYPLFLMVVGDKYPSLEQFRAIVLLDKAEWPDYCQGYESDAWNYSSFEKSSWKELKKFI